MCPSCCFEYIYAWYLVNLRYTFRACAEKTSFLAILIGRCDNWNTSILLYMFVRGTRLYCSICLYVGQVYAALYVCIGAMTISPQGLEDPSLNQVTAVISDIRNVLF